MKPTHALTPEHPQSCFGDWQLLTGGAVWVCSILAHSLSQATMNMSLPPAKSVPLLPEKPKPGSGTQWVAALNDLNLPQPD